MSTAQPSRPVDPVRPPGVLQLFSVGGIPVYLSWSWFVGALLLLALFYGQSSTLFDRPLQAVAFAVGVCVGLFASILLHEGAHALVAKLAGHRVLNVTLTFWGGATRSVTYQPRPLTSALIALAGPAANLVLAALGMVLALAAGGHPGLGMTVSMVVWINVVLAGYNLLPGLPLDGGQVTASIVWALTRNHTTGIVVAGWAGRAIVVVIGTFWLWTDLRAGRGGANLLWTVMVVVILWQMTTQTIQRAQQRRELDRLQVGTVGRPAILLPDSMPQQLACAYAQPGRAFILHNQEAVTGVIPQPGVTCLAPLDPIRYAALPVAAQPLACPADAPVTDIAIAMQAEGRLALAVRLPDGSGRVLTLDDIVTAAARQLGMAR